MKLRASWMLRLGAVGLSGFILGAAPAKKAADPVEKLDRVVGRQSAADEKAAASQTKINEVDDKTREMAVQYRQDLADAESLSTYADQLAAQVVSQEAEIQSIHTQLDGIEDTDRAVFPLMQRMVDTLARFVPLDLPFLVEERTKRVAGLEDLLKRADVSISEKYRRILEAYQIEMEYGRTLETYTGTIEQDGVKRSVEFIRVGRISLLYHTEDGSETGYWDRDQKAWILDDDYARAMRDALRVAKQKGAPELMLVPVPASVDAGVDAGERSGS